MTMNAREINRLLLPNLVLALVLAGAGCPQPKEAGSAPSPSSSSPAASAATPGVVAIRTIKVVIIADRQLEVPGLSQQVVEARVRAQLEAAPSIRFAPEGKEAGYRLVLEMAVARAAPGAGLTGPAAAVACRAGIPGNVDAVVLRAQAVAPLGDQLAQANVKKTLNRLLDAVLDDVIFQAGLSLASGEDLARQLAKLKDLQRLIPAVEIAGRRRLAQTVPPLIALLKHREQEVADGAVGALVALGDRRAVKPLTHLSKLSDTARLARILDAIASLGGDEAHSFLEFVASGHDDEDIRFMATEALERMKRLNK